MGFGKSEDVRGEVATVEAAYRDGRDARRGDDEFSDWDAKENVARRGEGGGRRRKAHRCERGGERKGEKEEEEVVRRVGEGDVSEDV